MPKTGPTANPDVDDARFTRKLRVAMRRTGRGVLEKALILYGTLRSPSTPAWARRSIVGALAYFILPTDLVPDVLVGVGYTDDLAVLAAALATVSVYITPEIRAQARERLSRLLGD